MNLRWFRLTLASVFFIFPAFLCASELLKDKHFTVKTPFDGGIRENIPSKYKERYEKWKTELLSTEFGRQQWENYSKNTEFILTITISGERGQGAATEKFLWDENGKFVGATIFLGNKLDSGVPPPIYYPVMNSLGLRQTEFSINGNILAATKIIHEIGHVNQMAEENKEIVELQDKLIPEYVNIFLKNGRNANDPKLVNLEQQIGGTPTKIWENREYWSETTAMLFLDEKIRKENFYCSVFNKIINNVEQYARGYEKRFEEIAASKSIASTCRK